MADRTDHVPLPRRPLPIGAFPLPFGYLLLPDTEEAGPARESLLAGRQPEEWPAVLRGHALALRGDLAGAAAAMTGADPVSRYNRFVLDPDAVDVAALRTDLGQPLAVLVDVVLVSLGRSDTPPSLDGLDGELAAMALAAAAALQLEAGAATLAVELLDRAVAEARTAYPALAGVLCGAWATVHRAAGQDAEARAALESGIELLTGTDLTTALGELQLELGSLLHEAAAQRPDLLAKAVHYYHCVLQTIGPDEAPELFAAAHANLASAYLTMPMVEASDQLRLGVAIGSLRAALTVYQPESHPAQWSSTQLNLANALVYAPSTHQADNLVEAVDLYEAVLRVRDRDADPLGYARALANQGNALAHLGLFDQARGKLVESRYIFEELHDYDATSSVRGLLDEIARQTALHAGDSVLAGDSP
jgi:tetratricopeptide (TPR) repeat protein